MKRILQISLLISLLTCCGHPIEYQCQINHLEDTGNIPQDGTVIEVPVSYVLVQTKFQPARYHQPFRYRALMGGKEYSYAERLFSDSLYEEETSFNVVVPRNNSYEKRDIVIEVSLAKSFKDQSWGDWETVYTATQDCVDKGQSLRPATDGRVITFIFDGVEMEVEASDNESARCLKDLLLDGEITLEMSVATNGMSTVTCEGVNKLENALPLYHTAPKKIYNGEIYLGNAGYFRISTYTYKTADKTRETYLGRLTDESFDKFNNLCRSGKYTGLNNTHHPMVMTLK